MQVLMTFLQWSHFVLKNKKEIAVGGKNSISLKWPQKFLNYVTHWYLANDQKRCSIYFWKLNVNAKLKEQNEKEMV